MLSPLLIIGVGGSGGKTIRAMKDSLRRKLKMKGWEGDLPEAWQFLQIDTTYDGLDFEAEMLQRDEVCLVVPNGATFESVKEQIENLGATKQEKNDIMAGWGIPYSALNINDGAGMIRGIGRQVGIGQAQVMQRAIQSAVNSSNAGQADLIKLAQLLQKNPAQVVDNQMRCFIISSLAGGSGAGMFVDVAEIIKRTYKGEPWAQKSVVSLLYTAEVFEDLKGAGDVRQNCLGAVNEIVAGKYRTATSRTDTLMTKLQLPNHDAANKTIGSQGNILIGSRNAKKINLAKDGNGFGMNEVFLTIGETLAGVVSNPSIAEFLYKQVIVNVTSSTKNSCLTGLVPADVVLPFASMGFGRVTIGIDRVIQYMTNALTQRQVSDLLYPEMVQRVDQNALPKDKLLAARIDESFQTFLRKSHLNEKQNANDITDALIPQNMNAVVAKMSEYILQEISGASRPLAPLKAAQLTWDSWQTTVEKSFEEIYDEIRKNASKWTSEIQNHVVDLVAEYVATNGLQVAAGLLDELMDDLRVVTSDADLGREIANARSKIERVNSSWWQTKVTEAAGTRQGLSQADGPVIQQLSDLIRGYAAKREEAWRKNLAKELIEDLLENFLGPLATNLRENFLLLKGAVESKDPMENDGINLATYPTWGKPVPNAYFPRSIERTLIDPKDFPKFYAEAAILDIPTETQVQPFDVDFGASVFNLSTSKALLGIPFDNKENKRQSIISFKRWSPKAALASNEFPQKAEFYMSFKLRHLDRRNEDWLLYKGSEMSRLATTSIKDFCNAKGNVLLQSERSKAFATSYAQMMDISEPLTTFNTKALSSHVKDPSGKPPLEIMRKSVKVPFAPTDNVSQSVISTLTNLGINTNDGSFANQWFDPNSNDSEMFAISFTAGPLPAYVFNSLTNPIAESVRGAQNSGVVWSKYFTDRRSRPLPEAIPLSKPNLLSMITGWLTANWFGLLEDQTNLTAGKSQSIWNTTLEVPDWSQFPKPLLDGSRHDAESWLPQILTSLGLAYVNFGEDGDPVHLQPYQYLLYLGKEITTFSQADHWTLAGGDLLPTGRQGKSELVRKYVTEGAYPNLKTPLFLAGKNLPLQDPNDRVAALVSYAENFLTNFKSTIQQMELQPWENLPHFWELQTEIAESAKMITDYTRSLEIHSSTGVGV